MIVRLRRSIVQLAGAENEAPSVNRTIDRRKLLNTLPRLDVFIRISAEQDGKKNTPRREAFSLR